MTTAAASARRITTDWAGRFPGFEVWRTRWLLRRLGPVVEGIMLDLTSDGEGYFPTAHVHCLAAPFPTVTLSLAERLRGSSGQPERVERILHAGEFENAAHRLELQSSLSLSEPPDPNDIVAAYHGYAAVRAKAGVPAVLEMAHGVLLSAALGKNELTELGLDLAAHLSAEWPFAPVSGVSRDGSSA